jgi:protein-tyrosine phosphatase
MNFLDYISSSISIILDRTSDLVKNIFSTNEVIDNQNNNDEKTYKKRLFIPIPYLTQLEWFYGEPTHIIDNIYLGSAINASHYNTLKNRNIGLVINMTYEISNYFPNEIEYINYPLYDNNQQSIKQYLLDAYDKIISFQINNRDKNILIHCFMGASRSASVVIYYLMKKYNYTLNEAIQFAKNKRYLVNPTMLFYNELSELENE